MPAQIWPACQTAENAMKAVGLLAPAKLAAKPWGSSGVSGDHDSLGGQPRLGITLGIKGHQRRECAMSGLMHLAC